MKKTLIFIALSFCLSYARAQWQEITQYGPVKDFLYINDKLMYIWGDTNYIVENGQARMVADFGFEKNYNYNSDIYTPQKPADFVKGTLIGFMRKLNSSEPGSLDIYKTVDGGITWNKFAYYNFPDSMIWVTTMAIDSETVYFQGIYQEIQIPSGGILPLIKIKKNIKIEYFYPKVENGNVWNKSVVGAMYFFDASYGLGISSPFPYNKHYLVRTFNGGRNFIILDSNYYNDHRGEIIAIDKKIILLREAYNLSISTDSGMTWKLINKIKYISNKVDTLITGATVINEDLFYLRENIYSNSSKPTISILYHKKLSDLLFDSVMIKPTQFIECYDNNRCFIYNPYFYQNFNPIVHPLSDKELSKKLDINPKLLYNSDHIELDFPSNAQSEQFQLMLYDMSGKLILTDNITKHTENYKLNLNESLPQGIYIINLKSNSQVFSLKFFN